MINEISCLEKKEREWQQKNSLEDCNLKIGRLQTYNLVQKCENGTRDMHTQAENGVGKQFFFFRFSFLIKTSKHKC